MARVAEFNEQRCFSRVPAMTDVVLWRSNGSEAQGRLHDISCEGFSLDTEAELGEHERVHLIIAGGLVSLEPVEVEAEVLHVEPAPEGWHVGGRLIREE